MANPFFKYLTEEDRLHGNCVAWLRYQHPKLRIVHPPLEGKRTPFERYKASVLGISYSKGAADLLIFSKFPSGAMKAVAVEFKCGKNKQTKEQKEFQADWLACGGMYEVCISFEQFQELIKLYF